MTRSIPNIEPDDFAQWRDHRVSKAFFAAMRVYAEECRGRWIDMSWGAARADPLVLRELHGQADACHFFADAELMDILKLLAPPDAEEDEP